MLAESGELPRIGQTMEVPDELGNKTGELALVPVLEDGKVTSVHEEGKVFLLSADALRLERRSPR